MRFTAKWTRFDEIGKLQNDMADPARDLCVESLESVAIMF